MIRVLLVDNKTSVRTAIANELNNSGKIKIIAQAGNHKEAIESCVLFQPDVILLDIALPKISGYQTALKMMKENISSKIVFFSMLKSSCHIYCAKKIGIDGFVGKEEKLENLYKVILEVNDGKKCFPNIEKKENCKFFDYTIVNTVLTEKELEIFCLIGKGYSTSNIASDLYISKRTVDFHRANIIRKLEIKERAKLLYYATKYNFLIGN